MQPGRPVTRTQDRHACRIIKIPRTFSSRRANRGVKRAKLIIHPQQACPNRLLLQPTSCGYVVAAGALPPATTFLCPDPWLTGDADGWSVMLTCIPRLGIRTTPHWCETCLNGSARIVSDALCRDGRLAVTRGDGPRAPADVSRPRGFVWVVVSDLCYLEKGGGACAYGEPWTSEPRF